MEIRSKSDLSLAYELLELSSSLSPTPHHDVIIELKRRIRRYNNRPPRDRRFICGDVDGYVELINVPDDVKDVEEWFMNNEYRECRPSMYDCTGQKFTVGYKIVNRHGRRLVYHTVGIDV